MRYLPLLLWLLPTTLLADGAVELTWKDPDSYRDIRPADEAAKRFRERLFRNIEQHLQHLAEKLPEGSRLEITFTNLDLAGEVQTGRHGSVRIIRDTQPARLEFSYRCLDSHGNITQEGSEQLWGTTTSSARLDTRRNEPFAVEKSLLTRWFNRTF